MPSLPEGQTPRDIAGRRKVYAYERSLGTPPAEACRLAGGNVEKGDAAKWERDPRVKAWIGYLNSIGFTAEAAAAAASSEYVGVFDLARAINAALGAAPKPETAVGSAHLRWCDLTPDHPSNEAHFCATSPRGPVFYSSWFFRSIASFLPSSWLSGLKETFDA